MRGNRKREQHRSIVNHTSSYSNPVRIAPEPFTTRLVFWYIIWAPGGGQSSQPSSVPASQISLTSSTDGLCQQAEQFSRSTLSLLEERSKLQYGASHIKKAYHQLLFTLACKLGLKCTDHTGTKDWHILMQKTYRWSCRAEGSGLNSVLGLVRAQLSTGFSQGSTLYWV